MPEDLLRAVGLVVGLTDIAGCRLQSDQWSVKTESDIDAVANGYEFPLELIVTPSPAIDVRPPVGDGALPEQNSVVGIPGDEIPFGRLQAATNGGFVDQVENTPAG